MKLRTLMFSAVVLAGPARAMAGPTRQPERRDRMGRHRPAGDPRPGGAAIGRHLRDPAHDGAPRGLRRGRRHRRRLAAVRREDRRRSPAPTSAPRSRPPPISPARPRVARSPPRGVRSGLHHVSRQPAGRAGVVEGVRVGQQAAAAMLALRANDGFANVVPYECSAMPPPIGEFVPDTGCPTGAERAQPVDAKVGGITPFTLKHADVVPARRPDAARVEGATPATSPRPATTAASTARVRSPEQTDIAWFWAENPYVHWNRNLMALAQSKGLSVRRTARLFAMVHTAGVRRDHRRLRGEVPLPRLASADGDSAGRRRRQPGHRRRSGLASADLGEPSRVPVGPRLLVDRGHRQRRRVLRHGPRRLDADDVEGGGAGAGQDRADLRQPDRAARRRSATPASGAACTGGTRCATAR